MTSESSSSLSVEIRKYNTGAPWIFKGRALYQLHAVKSSVARKFVPPELKLVEAFGYTLGGIFLAHYEDSPAGEFDEAVVIAGIVWNPPTSCAWAGRVLVGSEEARVHGRMEVGLPSYRANFLHKVATLSGSPRPWCGVSAWFRSKPKEQLKPQHSVDIEQTHGDRSIPLFKIVGLPDLLPNDDSFLENQRWRGPSVQLFLPNFSGKTKDQPSLLKYSCALNCAVRVVKPAKVIDIAGKGSGDDQETRDVVAILKEKPLASIFFDKMVMRVEAPTLLVLKNGKKQKMTEPAAGDTAVVVPATTSSATTP